MVNIIIPAWNCADTLGKALSSLMSQTKSMFIVTIVNDNSDEELDEIVEQYRAFLNIRYIKNKENLGPGPARQIGIDSDNQCDYVMFLDSDDILYPRAVEILYRDAKLYGVDVIYSNIAVERGGALVGSLSLGKNTTWTHGKIYRKKFLVENNIRFPDTQLYNEDSYFNLVCNLLAKNKRFINETTYLWRNCKTSLTRSKDGKFIFDHNIDYLLMQIWALEKVISSNITNEALGATIANIFNAYQIELIIDAENLKRYNINEKLRSLFSKSEITTLIHNYKTHEYIIKNLKQGHDGKDYFYFKQSFKQWYSLLDLPV